LGGGGFLRDLVGDWLDEFLTVFEQEIKKYQDEETKGQRPTIDAMSAILDHITMPDPPLLSEVSGSTQVLELTEDDLNYGLAMLERNGRKLRGAVSTDNQYERKLLPEVLSTEDAGGGFVEVGALEGAKEVLRECVQLPLQHPHLFSKGALSRPCLGVLLFGPPGTGKSLLARGTAAECGASFLTLSPATLSSKWVGDGVRYVKAAFSLAGKLAPSVIFVDEVDSLLGRRDMNEHEAMREMKNEFMSQWDGIRSRSTQGRVMVLGATNRPFDLDDAVLRRFSRRIFMPLPDKESRRSILEVILGEERLGEDVDIEKVAELSDGFSGSDLRNLCMSAAMRPVRDLLKATGRSAQQEKDKCKDKDTREGANEVQVPGKGSTAGQMAPKASASASSSSSKFVKAVNVLEEWKTLAEKQQPPPLRAITAVDFEKAKEETAPSTAKDSFVMNELRAWNEKYGEGGKNKGGRTQLSYYM